MVIPDLFEFAYVPGWYLQLDELADMALPEIWRFKKPEHIYKNETTPILERYVQSVFRKQAIDYDAEPDSLKKQQIFHFENEFSCFHTGLYTRNYKGIYACFGRNKKTDSLLKWYFKGFADELSPLLRYVSSLPEKPLYSMPLHGIHYFPDWPVRVNVEHILGDPETLSGFPWKSGRPAISLCCWKQRWSWPGDRR